ncbi:hypothetical protein [Rhizobium mesoamericanum]|uniref:hypothetical protein n=1 Tax=Rhizobium mesoamericanum TaxID=1079800 RepID=UPI0012DD74DB|nr:hypothetical protein [Rhizobium mesoamericanum]
MQIGGVQRHFKGIRARVIAACWEQFLVLDTDIWISSKKMINVIRHPTKFIALSLLRALADLFRAASKFASRDCVDNIARAASRISNPGAVC